MPSPGGNRPKGLHIKHLTEMERFRVRTLYYDAGMTMPRIKQVTGYSTSQIRTAVHAQTAAIPPRTGRPKRGPNGQTPTKKQPDNAGASSQNLSAEGESNVVAQGSNANNDNTPVAPQSLDIHHVQALQEASQQQQQQQQLSPLFTASPSSPSPSAAPYISSS